MSLFFSGAFVMVVRPSFFLNCPAPAIEKKRKFWDFFWETWATTEDRKAQNRLDRLENVGGERAYSRL